jgi:phosphocarrier protein HPr
MNTIEREFKILNQFGIHARPAALLVKTVCQFQSDVQVCKDGNLASGRSIMSLLTLEGYCGSTLKVSATGPDAGDVLDAIGDLIKNKFYEE